MYIDFAINDTEVNDAEAKLLVAEINKYPVNSITVPYYLIRSVKGGAHNTTKISSFIDYPLGISDVRTRRFAVEQSVKNGANCVDITMPQNLAANRKYDKIREDIKSIFDYCSENNVEIRYILEYRFFDHHCLKKICEIFDDYKIIYAYPSTGFFLDNLADNILASIFLHQNSKNLNVISSGNVWSEKHFDTITKSGLFGFRTNSIHSLRNFIEFNSTTKQK
jgi:deoxyribose-phosphate aldolase